MDGDALRSTLTGPIGYTVGLAAVGVGYPLWLALAGTLAPFDVLAPYLAAGIVFGFVADRALGGRGLVGLLRGDSGRLAAPIERLRDWNASQYEWPYTLDDPDGRGADPSRFDDASSDSRRDDNHEGDETREDGDDHHSWPDWLSLYSLVSMVGVTSWLAFTSPWFVGLVLGAIWIVVATRVVRACSPCSDGMARPPRGAPAVDDP